LENVRKSVGEACHVRTAIAKRIGKVAVSQKKFAESSNLSDVQQRFPASFKTTMIGFLI